MKNFLALIFFALASAQIAVAQEDARHWDMPTAYDGFHTETRFTLPIVFESGLTA